MRAKPDLDKQTQMHLHMMLYLHKGLGENPVFCQLRFGAALYFKFAASSRALEIHEE